MGRSALYLSSDNPSVTAPRLNSAPSIHAGHAAAGSPMTGNTRAKVPHHTPAGMPWRHLALISLAYVLAAASSYIDPRLAIGCCIAVFAAAAWRDPDLSLF